MPGLGFVLLYADNVLPGIFALPAGLGDAMAAVGATFIGIKLLCASEVSKQSLLRWNSYGLIDFLSAITVGTLLRSSLLGGTSSIDPLSSLPLSLIPTLVVPFCIITHLIIFLQSRMRCAPATTETPAGADLVRDFFNHQSRKQYRSCKPTQAGSPRLVLLLQPVPGPEHPPHHQQAGAKKCQHHKQAETNTHVRNLEKTPAETAD